MSNRSIYGVGVGVNYYKQQNTWSGNVSNNYLIVITIYSV